MEKFKISGLDVNEMKLVRDGDDVVIKKVSGDPLTKPIPIRQFREMVSQAQTVQGLNRRLRQKDGRTIQVLTTLAEKNPEAWRSSMQ